MAVRYEMGQPIPRPLKEYLVHLVRSGELKKYVRQGLVLGIAQHEEFHSDVARAAGIRPRMVQDERKRWETVIDDSGLIRAVPSRRQIQVFCKSFSYALADSDGKPLKKPDKMSSESDYWALLSSQEEVSYLFQAGRLKNETCRILGHLLVSITNVIKYTPEIWYDYNDIPTNPQLYHAR